MVVQHTHKIPPIEREELAFRRRDGIGGARAAVQKRDLAQDLVPADEVKDDLVSVAGGDADAHNSRNDNDKPGAQVAFPEQHTSGWLAGQARMRSKALDELGRCPSKELMLGEQRALVRDDFVEIHGARFMRPLRQRERSSFSDPTPYRG